MIGCNSFDAVLELLSSARANLNEILSAFEFIDAEAMTSVTAHLKVSNPISSSPFYVLIETSGSNATHDEQKLQMFLDAVMSSGLVTDGTIATVPSKIKVCLFLENNNTSTHFCPAARGTMVTNFRGHHQTALWR